MYKCKFKRGCIWQHMDLKIYKTMCMFDKIHWRSTWNLECHIFFINKNKCQLTCTFTSKMSPQCPMPSSTCHFDFCNIKWPVAFSFTTHITCQTLNRACQLTCILILCNFLRVKCHKPARTNCQKYTQLQEEHFETWWLQKSKIIFFVFQPPTLSY